MKFLTFLKEFFFGKSVPVKAYRSYRYNDKPATRIK